MLQPLSVVVLVSHWQGVWTFLFVTTWELVPRDGGPGRAVLVIRNSSSGCWDGVDECESPSRSNVLIYKCFEKAEDV